jgi:hypothetical protein
MVPRYGAKPFKRRRTMSPLYWERHPDGPFVTLIAVAATYLNPETYDLEFLKARAKLEDLEEMRVFKSELREALRDPSQLPGADLSESVEYGDGSDEAFLYWLWRQLYSHEQIQIEPVLDEPPGLGPVGRKGPGTWI